MKKTKEKIKEVACELFNHQGLAEVSLRDVAAAMNRAYGNITYHYPNKEALVTAIYADMLHTLQGISKTIGVNEDLLTSILLAPKKTFALSLQYLFLFKDYLEILRHYPELAESARKSNAARKDTFLTLLHQMQLQGTVRADIRNAELDYMMEVSGVMRTFFFVNLNAADFQKPSLEADYVASVNRIIYPYLTTKGQARYMEILGQW